MGEWQDKAEGFVKEKEGELTDDTMREKQGEAQGTWGDVKGQVEDAKEEVEERF